jgi:hypothetical protein
MSFSKIRRWLKQKLGNGFWRMVNLKTKGIQMLLLDGKSVITPQVS